MNLFQKILAWFRRPPSPGTGISLLVPFNTDHGRRAETWEWLRRYWKAELPGAEIVIGRNNDTPYCKTAAVNDAARRAHGDIFVILDADCYISGAVITDCADEIRRANDPLWYMPYRHFYRLTNAGSRYLMSFDPAHPPRFFAAPPPRMMLQRNPGVDSGHWYGALIQIMPREAFEKTGGMDERFRGWGGEDVAFMHAVDTVYGKHKTTPNGVIHLWHPSISKATRRVWAGQKSARANGNLAARYSAANGDTIRMLSLVSEPVPPYVPDDDEALTDDLYST